MTALHLDRTHFLVYDGAMGTMLQQFGLAPGESPDLFCLTNPDAVEQVHRAYVDAGAQLLCTNTFGANRRNLASSGHTVQEVIGAAVRIARRAADGRAKVALDIGPIGTLMAPMGNLTFDEAYDLFREMAIAGMEAGADLAAIETMADLAEVRAAILAVRENTTLPIFVTMTFEHSGRTYLGTTPESFALTAEALGVSALGVNCSEGPAALLPIVKRMARVTDLPLIVKPNAGLPGHGASLTPEEFAADMAAFAAVGVRIIGGCCGTGPDYIRALQKTFAPLHPRPQKPAMQAMACTAASVQLLDDRMMLGTSLLSESTSTKQFLEALASGDFEAILELIQADLDDGADLICIPIRESDQLEPAALGKMLEELRGFLTCPLVFVGSSAPCLETALRHYHGKACFLADDEADLDTLSDSIIKYGAMILGCQTQAE